ncbi:MAG: hypothetical protein IT463_06840 [Planctomycetes bacterium]|nr:hypothetical protein [Planctomycetota bacterium]
MTKAWALGFLVLAVAMTACGQGDNPGNTAAKGPPLSWDDQAADNWHHSSQFKTNMRFMWIGANRIVSAGRGDKKPTYDEIWTGAADVSRRAGLYLNYWKAIQESHQNLMLALDDDDRPNATDEFRNFAQACDGCHFQSWSPAYLHVTKGIMDGWTENKTTPPGLDMNEVDTEPPPSIPNREKMQALVKAYNNGKVHIEDWNKDGIRRAMADVPALVDMRVQHWQGVKDNADKIYDLARASKREGLKEAYEAMTGFCNSCHAQLVSGQRKYLAPMAWDAPTK